MRRAAALCLAAALAGCSLAPPFERPAPPVPASWPAGDAYLRTSEAALPALSFQDVLRDPRLQRLIEQARANNRDLRVAAANIVAARAQYRVQRADLFPQVDASAGYRRRGGGNNGAAVANGGAAGGDGVIVDPGTGTGTGGTGGGGVIVNPGNGGGGQARNIYSVDVGVTAFELDLFGRIRSLSEAALQRYFATEAAARATSLVLTGDIAEAWLTYAADRSLLAIAERTAESARRSVRLTAARLRGGIAPRTDLRQAEQVLATAESDLAEQRTALAQDVNALTLLVGGPVDANLLPATIEEAAATVQAPPAGLDSAILLRRPDVVQAEYELRAANAEIGAARAALFPRLSLTGVLGFASTALGSLFSDGAFNYSVAPSLDYPIFRAGAGRAGVVFSQAQRDAAQAGYERAIQIAFREVADALARAGTIAEQLAATERFTDAARDTARLADARYRGGIDTFLTSLDAQRSLYAAERELVATRLVGGTNRVALYRTLGGDATLTATTDGPLPASGTP